jgi:predicted RNA-binding protein with PUA-like domain
MNSTLKRFDSGVHLKTAQEYLPTCYWLMKTEPDVFSIDDLIARKREHWDGVRNYQARNFMRDHMKCGHKVLFYHSNTEIPAIVGTAEIIEEAIPDPSAWNKKSPYYDPKAKPENAPWCMVTVAKGYKFKSPVSLAALRQNKELEEMLLLRKGQRLSIQPVSEKEFEIVVKLGTG